MPRLIMRRGPTPGVVYELTAGEITIGRGRKNHIVINDNEVSREHCRLVRLVDDYELQDMNSVNGTFVNGLRVVSNWMLQPGMLVELGDSITLEYERTPFSDDRPTEFISPIGVISGNGTKPIASPNGASSTTVTEPEQEIRHCLMMTMGPTVGRVFFLSESIITIGRDLANDIIVQDPEVSRYHMRLRRTKTGYTVEDMGSTNGTYINGGMLNQPYNLEVNDVIRLGTMVQLQYIQQKSEESDERVSNTRTTTEAARDDTLFTSFMNPIAAQRKLSRLGTGLQPGALENHVFIAYARDEWESVIANLILSLQDAGLNVWVDQYLVQGSDDWRAAIEQALLECWLMVIVVSPNALASNYVKMEYRHFINREKPIIPLIHHPVSPMPPELSRQRTLMYDAANPRKTFHKLIFEIMQLRR